MEFKDYAIGFLLTCLCLVGMMTFLSGMAKNYGYGDSYMKDERIDYSAIENAVSSTNSQAIAWSVSFQKSNPLLALGELALSSIWSIIILIFIVPITFFQLLATGTIGVLGVPSIFLGTLLDVLIISLIVAGWKMYKNP